MTPAQVAHIMPPLPETPYQLYYEWPDDEDGYGGSEVVDGDAYTADQMREYARAAVEAALRDAPQAEGWVPEALYRQTLGALAGLLEQVEKYASVFGEADFETAEALRAVEAAVAHEAVSAPTAVEPDERDDPLQGAVDWFLQADGEFFCVATVQRTLRIGYNRAKRLCDLAKARASKGTP